MAWLAHLYRHWGVKPRRDWSGWESAVRALEPGQPMVFEIPAEYRSRKAMGVLKANLKQIAYRNDSRLHVSFAQEVGVPVLRLELMGWRPPVGVTRHE